MSNTIALIFEERFLVKVPYIDTCSDDYLKIFGTPTTGDKDIDKVVNSEWVDVCIPICDMVDYYRKGVNIKVTRPGDVKKIYDNISAHLSKWANNLDYGLNIGNAPIQDLIDLDRFANIVYAHAKYHITPELVSSLMGQRLNAIGGMENIFKSGSAGALMTKRIADPNYQPIKTESGYPERKSLEKLFSSRIRGSSR